MLPAEASSLVSNGMSVERAASNLQARDFARRLDAMAADAASHPETQDLTAAYRSRIERQLGPGARLAGFGCGMSLCMGAIRTDDAHRYQAWADRFLKDDSTPSYVFTDLVVTLAAGDVEGRFLFSTDPGVASAVMRATP